MNNNRFTYHGTVHELMPVQTFNSGFKKRDFVCKVEGEKYTDFAVFTAKKETCDKIATLKPGDEVAIEFALDGHEWDGPKGKRWFGGATALKVELAGGVNKGSLNATPPPATAPQEPPHIKTDKTIDEVLAGDPPF